MERFDWHNSDDRRDWVHRAVQSLVEGRLVVFPTETVYGLAASALDPLAVERLLNAKGRPDQKPLTLALARAEDSHSYVSAMSVVGRRLVQRCWPGPVTMVFEGADEAGAIASLPAAVRRRVVSACGIGLRVPDHPAILETLELLPGPMVLTSANQSGQADPTDADSAVAAVGQAVDIVLDDGPTRYARASTVIQVAGDSFTVLREGVVPGYRLRRLASEMITFVCTGNTCRSPMAEAIFKRTLASELGCQVDELPARGYTIQSAGVAAVPGAPASPQASTVVREYNVSLDDHVSQLLSEELARLSDRLVVMTQAQKDVICRLWPEVGPKTALLCGDQDVIDPFGGSNLCYRQCAEQIAEHLCPLLADLKMARNVHSPS